MALLLNLTAHDPDPGDAASADCLLCLAPRTVPGGVLHCTCCGAPRVSRWQRIYSRVGRCLLVRSHARTWNLRPELNAVARDRRTGAHGRAGAGDTQVFGLGRQGRPGGDRRGGGTVECGWMSSR